MRYCEARKRQRYAAMVANSEVRVIAEVPVQWTSLTLKGRTRKP